MADHVRSPRSLVFSLIFSKWFLYICFLLSSTTRSFSRSLFLLSPAVEYLNILQNAGKFIEDARCINPRSRARQKNTNSRLVNVDYNTSSEDYILLFTFFPLARCEMRFRVHLQRVERQLFCVVRNDKSYETYIMSLRWSPGLFSYPEDSSLFSLRIFLFRNESKQCEESSCPAR